jgi:3-oxoacyl-[acyl-carrier protein] reductase
MELGLKGKYALITGGSHGIGRSIAIELAKEGVNIAICSRTQSKLDETISILKQYNVDSISVNVDVLEADAVDKVMNVINKRWGKLDILVNNVGGGGRWGKEEPLDTKPEVWTEVYQKNAGVAAQFTMKSLPYMLKNKWGRVITITSTYGLQGGGRPWFNMAKAAETALMKNLAIKKTYARSGITFNSIAPGGIKIPGTGWEDQEKNDPEAFARFLDENWPMGRMGLPEEVANVVVFISSPKSSLVNGASILVDGGECPVF